MRGQDAKWRHPDLPADGSSDFHHFLRCARVAEDARFDMVFFADGMGVRDSYDPPGSPSHFCRNVELEPLSALAPMTTRHIGLVSTAFTTYNEPFHIARKFASLDHISGGRAGPALQALAMRLGQMGRDAHWLHDVAPPPLRLGDVFLANASAGDLPTTVALLRRARELGARTALVTAADRGPALDEADTVLRLPAQAGQGTAVLPLGGQYELALWVVGDLAMEKLRARLGLARDVFATGHVNLG